MKTYSDLTDIDTRLHLVIELTTVGIPTVDVNINSKKYHYSELSAPVVIEDYLPLLDTIDIGVVLSNKHYTLEYETAVTIIRLCIDDIELIPRYDHLADYVNDHHNKTPTHYLGFNGKWTLTIDQPFYRWLHCHSGQGWLLS
jgi:hypothetical protein